VRLFLSFSPFHLVARGCLTKLSRQVSQVACVNQVRVTFGPFSSYFPIQVILYTHVCVFIHLFIYLCLYDDILRVSDAYGDRYKSHVMKSRYKDNRANKMSQNSLEIKLSVITAVADNFCNRRWVIRVIQNYRNKIIEPRYNHLVHENEIVEIKIAKSHRNRSRSIIAAAKPTRFSNSNSNVSNDCHDIR